MKISLGTAQFGLTYGAFNHSGQVPLDEVRKIMDFALTHGIDSVDTAQAYGKSESVLGEVNAGLHFQIVTKISALTDVKDFSANELRLSVMSSLERLKVAKVHGLLLHRAADLLERNGPMIWRCLEELRDEGYIQKIGFSAYGPEEALSVMKRYPVQLIQIPLNVFDSRHRDAGVLDYCEAKGIAIHARSVFLQGFLLSNPDKLAGYLSKWRDLLRIYQENCRDIGVSPLRAALMHVVLNPVVERAVVGVDGLNHLMELVSCLETPTPLRELHKDWGGQDIELITPSLWR